MAPRRDLVTGYRLSRSPAGPMAVVIAVTAFGLWVLVYAPG